MMGVTISNISLAIFLDFCPKECSMMLRKCTFLKRNIAFCYHIATKIVSRWWLKSAQNDGGKIMKDLTAELTPLDITQIENMHSDKNILFLSNMCNIYYLNPLVLISKSNNLSKKISKPDNINYFNRPIHTPHKHYL